MPTSPPSEPVDASGGGLPVPPDGVLPLDAIETIELVRGDVLPPPDWERPATVRPTRPQPSSSGSPIPRPPPQPVPVEARGRSAPIGRTPPTGPRPSGPIVAARPPWPTTSTGPSAPEPEALHVDVGLDDGGLGDVGLGDVGLGVATHVGAGPRPQGAPTTGGDRRGGTDSDGDSDRGHDARGAQRDGPGASTTVRLAPRRRLTAVLA